MDNVDDVGHIRLAGISATGHHGVLASERQLGQPFVVDVDLEVAVDTSRDDLAGTVNYADIAQLVVAEIAGEPVNLIETLASRIADRCLDQDPRVQAVGVSVHKPHAPVGVVCDDVVVSLHRRRTA